MSRRKPYDSLHETSPRRPAVWRSLEEKYTSAEDRREQAESEKPGGFMGGLISAASLKKRKAAGMTDVLKAQPKVSRRGFLATGVAAAGALTLEGCARRPVENILPYVEGPEYQIPGMPIHFATVTQRGNDAIGLLVTSHEGRPTKVEGNPNHPRSLGATDTAAQLAIWDLYDPDRSQGPGQFAGEEWTDKTNAEFDEALAEILRTHQGNGGNGLRFLLPPTNSPSVMRVRGEILRRMPNARFHTYASVDDDNIREGARLAFGQALTPIFNLSHADVVLSLDSDFLGTETGHVRNTKSFASRRRIKNPDTDRMNRLYAVEGTFSVTGATADHRLRLPSQNIEGFLKALAGRVGVQGANGSDEGFDAAFLDALAADLQGAEGRALVLVGRRQPPHVHALAHLVNDALGAVSGRVVTYQTVADDSQPVGRESLAELAAATDVQTLFILGGNPIYDAPADVDIAGLLGRDGVTSIALTTHRNETAKACTWHVPQAVELESWGDQRAADGTISIQQPLIQPLFGGRPSLELLARVAGERNWRGHYVVRNTFRRAVGAGGGFENRWRRALHAGVVAGSAPRSVRPTVQQAAVLGALSSDTPAALGDGNFEVVFAQDHRLFDGRYANNLWALEAPEPMTKLVWDNAALMSKATMEGLGIRNGAMVRLAKGDASIEVAAFTLPGHADHTVTLHLGWGRSAAGTYGNKQEWQGLGPGLGVERDWMAGGFDVQPLRKSDGFYFTSGVSVEPTGEDYWLVTTQDHDSMEGRPIAIDATLEEYRADPEFASYQAVEMNVPPLWEQVDYSAHEVATGRTLHRWGMVIDLSACVGCNACSIACQAENNIPAVGKQETARGREMTWLRIDRYYLGEDDNPQVAMQPIGCQQCEEAPCENVCPVNATVHSPEGLNDMAYNRCIGTRYCANNCPYKVRRFNYLDWHSHLDDPWTMHGNFPETRKLAFNPNVTVRMRGVMEKCSYCVQRISEAKFKARREHRQVRDGDVVVACQQVCSSDAISFGDLNDPESRVSKADETNRRYKLLAEIGARPRTTFLGKIRNPNPALESAETSAHGEEH